MNVMFSVYILYYIYTVCKEPQARYRMKYEREFSCGFSSGLLQAPLGQLSLNTGLRSV